jgi:flagellar P-ring protein precursor FlgI
MKRYILPLLLTALSALPSEAASVRLRELVDIEGMRENELIGYGLVVGLSGTGDTEQVFFTNQSISGMLGRLGIRVDPKDVRVRNVAAVMVTAKLPTYARPGTKIDVSVGAIGNARSLEGGVLLLTPLKAADEQTYAVAQGAVQVGGFLVASQGSQFRKNQPNSGRVPNGATIERATGIKLEGTKKVVLSLKRPDFSTAASAASSINDTIGDGVVATALDAGTVEVVVDSPSEFVGKPVELLARLEALEIETIGRAKVVISERTGTIVAGERARIRPVAVAHAGMKLSIAGTNAVSQPNAFGQGTTTQVQNAQIGIKEDEGKVVALPAAASVQELAAALNTLGVKPRDLVIILQAIRAAGALDADLEVL